MLSEEKQNGGAIFTYQLRKYKYYCVYIYSNTVLIRVGPLMSGRPWSISWICPKHWFRCKVLFRWHTWCRVTTTLHIENDDLYKEKIINIIDYLIDYTLPIISDNRLWKISDFPSLISSLDKGKDVRFIFCDISKAFDRVWHKGILHKLKHYGISEQIVNWIDNYLSHGAEWGRPLRGFFCVSRLSGFNNGLFVLLNPHYMRKTEHRYEKRS